MFALISPFLFALVIAVVGCITPGYHHINHTISRLAIEKYGWIQAINFLQLSVGLYLTGENLAATLGDQKSRLLVRRMFFLGAAIFVFAAIIPTDPIENVRLSLRVLTPTGALHGGIVLLFSLATPFGIARLAHIFARDKRWRTFAAPTQWLGYSSFILSVLWFLLYVGGVFLEYRGLFQKLIALLPLVWMIFANRKALRYAL